MDTTISIIVFLAPGLLASKVSETLDPNFKDRVGKPSELESTVFATLNNLPGILISWILWSVVERNALSFAQWSAQITQLPGTLIYLALSLLLAFYVELNLKPSVSRWVGKKRNDQRSAQGLPKFESAEAWEIFLGSEDELCLRISSLTDKKDHHISGILRCAFRPDDLSQGITLEDTEELESLDRWLFDPIRTYVDIRTGLIYELFTQTQLQQAVELAEIANKSKA